MTLAPRASSGPVSPVVPSDQGPAHPRRGRWRRLRVTLPLKTTLGLLILLIAAVAICGLVFLQITRSITQETKRLQLEQFAYTLSTLLGNDFARGPATVQKQLDELQQTPDLSFIVATDVNMQALAAHIADARTWQTYEDTLRGGRQALTLRIGQVQLLAGGHDQMFVTAVPVFRRDAGADGIPGRTVLAGYLHVGSGAAALEARLRYLHGIVLVVCMLVVLAALPIAYIIARHITVPILTLARAARDMAQGSKWQFVHFRRSDEIGQLAEAFNTMAQNLGQQQEHIRRINAGLEQKVHERTAELEKVNTRLQAEMAEKEDFLRAVSHDLNAPLRNISGMAAMLLLKYGAALEADAVQRLERIQKNVEVECDLLNELLELSRLKSRRDKIEAVDLQELVEALAEQFASDLETKRITLNVVGRLPVLHCEKARFRQLFQNLIDNAIKYMNPDGPRTITLSAVVTTDEVQLAVADTGIGIAAEDLPSIFHVFRCAKNASVMKIPGKGVGLASVKSILENYNARIQVQSTPGTGTTFHFALPKQYFHAAAPTKMPRKASAAGPAQEVQA